jgi:hypothetical protein
MEATMNIKRNLLIVSLLVVLVLPTSFAFAAGSEDVKGVNLSNCENYKFDQTISRSYSYDTYDDYGASLSGSEVDHVTSFPWEVAISFPCAEASVEINSFSANPELMVAQRYAEAMAKSVDSETNNFSANPELAWVHGGYSGDDAYDQAVSDVPGSSEAVSGGSFSGDDNYDLAAGAVL